MDVSLYNDPSQIPLAHHALDELAACHDLPARSVALVHVAIEEHLTNIVSYGYNAGQKGTITLRFTLQAATLSIEIEDDARPFNPLKAPEVDTSLPIETKPIGGLGVHIMRKSMDALDYRRVDGRNILMLRKRIDPGNA